MYRLPSFLLVSDLFCGCVPRRGDKKSNVGDTDKGTITQRARRDGSIAYKVEIVIRRDGKRHKASQTLDSEKAAERWMKRKEKQPRAPGGLDQAQKPTGPLSNAIDRYIEDHAAMGKTKTQVLRAIKTDPIAFMDCASITSQEIVENARRLGKARTPQTVMDYLSHFSAVFRIARPTYGFPLDYQAVRDGTLASRRLGLTDKSIERSHRPSIEEMDALMAYFEDSTIRTDAMPMHVISAFAMFATRRQKEVCGIHRDDYEPEHNRILARDMKHPSQKKGNDVWTELPPEANAILEKHGGPGRLFPYNSKTYISAI